MSLLNGAHARIGRRGAAEASTDGALVARVLAGDRGTYAVLVRRHQATLFRHARGMGLDPDTAEDMVQETLVRGYSRLSECRNPERFRAWLFRILRNRCLDHLKNVRRRDVPLEPGAGEEVYGVDDPTELRHELESALECLSPLLREAFLLKHEAGYSYDELAEVTDTSPSAVKMRVHRAREELRALLTPPEGGRVAAAPASDVTTGTRRSSDV